MVLLSLMLITFVLFGAYYYVEAVKYAMNKKRWLLAGVMFGPMVFPMFNINKQINMRRSIGFENLYLKV